MIIKVFSLVMASLFFLTMENQTVHAALTIQNVVSSKGIKAWLVEDHNTSAIALHFSFKAGSAYVSKEKAGLINLLAHLLDEGAGPYDSHAFAEKLQEHSILLDFSCGYDLFEGNLKTTSQHRREAFNLLKWALTKPHMNPNEFNKIRASLITNLKLQEKTPDYLALQAFRSSFLAQHPYEIPLEGTQSSLQGLKPEDLKTFMKQGFTKDNLIIGVCGNITPQELKEALDILFEDLPETSNLPPLPPFKLSLKESLKVIPADFPQSLSLFAQKGLRPLDPDFVCLVLLNCILGGSSSSRLFSEVRIQRGNAYSVSTALQNYEYVSFLSGEMGSDNAKVIPSVQLIRRIWAEMKEKGIMQSELDEAKSSIVGAFIHNLTSSPKIAHLIHYYQRWGYPLDYPQKRANIIQGITLHRMNKFAQKFLDPQGLSFIVVGQPKS